MAFSISDLTNVVNRYLNSISDVGAAASSAAEAAERRTVFRDTLGEAIKAEAQRNLPDFPDISSMIQQNMESHMRVDTTFQAKTATDSEAGNAAASSDLAKEIANAVTSGSSGSTTNTDAFKGQLSTEALQELARSSYFSGNLIQSNLFNEGTDGVSSSSTDSGSSLSDLNAKYLLAAYLNKGTDSSSTTSVFGDFTL